MQQSEDRRSTLTIIVVLLIIVAAVAVGLIIGNGFGAAPTGAGERATSSALGGVPQGVSVGR